MFNRSHYKIMLTLERKAQLTDSVTTSHTGTPHTNYMFNRGHYKGILSLELKARLTDWNTTHLLYYESIIVDLYSAYTSLRFFQFVYESSEDVSGQRNIFNSFSQTEPTTLVNDTFVILTGLTIFTLICVIYSKTVLSFVNYV